MTLVTWVRSRARVAVDDLFCASAPDIKRVGDDHSGWVININPLPQVAYCAGVGQGISFEQELAKTGHRPLLVFDPSPAGVETITESDTSNILFFPIGLASKTGVIEFSLTEHAGQVSCGNPESGFGTVSFECYDLPTIMSRNGDSYIDLLKMDIEGFEFDIINQFLDQNIPVRQLCVEFHPWLRPGATLRTMARLYCAGYRIIYKKHGDFTFLLSDSRYAELRQNRTLQKATAS